jgi:Fic family protein
MGEPEEGDRKSVAAPPQTETDPDAIARKEASNALLQVDELIKYIDAGISSNISFRLRPSVLLDLNRIVLEGVNPYAGNYRPAEIYITGSEHKPPPRAKVPEEVEELCEYVNTNFPIRPAIHLAAYVMWRMNWIHPFDDGNGRTARAGSYLVLNVKLGYRLPGKKSLVDFIVNDKRPYYAALEDADAAWRNGVIDVSTMERLLEDLLSAQLVSVLEDARGQPIESEPERAAGLTSQT